MNREVFNTRYRGTTFKDFETGQLFGYLDRRYRDLMNRIRYIRYQTWLRENPGQALASFQTLDKLHDDQFYYENVRIMASIASEILRRFPNMTVEEILTWHSLTS